MFKLSFKTNNAAFDENGTEEMARILREVANRVADVPGYGGTIQDIKGNTIGSFKLT